MTTQISNILNFPTFYKKVKNQPHSFKVAYKLAKLSEAIEKEITFYQTELQKLLAQYAQIDNSGNYIPTADGQGVMLKPETSAECNARLTELMSLEVEIPDVEFTFEDFEKIELTVDELRPIMMFIKE